jgi:hypothetical protein
VLAAQRGKHLAYRRSSHRLIRPRQTDAAESVCEMFGEMFTVERLDAGLAAANSAQQGQLIVPHGVELTQINDHLRQAKLGVGE